MDEGIITNPMMAKTKIKTLPKITNQELHTDFFAFFKSLLQKEMSFLIFPQIGSPEFPPLIKAVISHPHICGSTTENNQRMLEGRRGLDQFFFFKSLSLYLL